MVSDENEAVSHLSVVEAQIRMPGQRLQKARELRGLSIAQVAHDLRLSAKFVEAIEGDRYKELPEPAFIRGYMRRYAQLVRLSPDDIAASFDQCYSADLETPDLHARGQNPVQLLGSLVRPRLSMRKLLPWLSMAVVLVLAVGFVWNSFSKREKPPVTTTIESSAPAENKSAPTVVEVPVNPAAPTAMPLANNPNTSAEAAPKVDTTTASTPATSPLVMLPTPTAPATHGAAIPERAAQPSSMMTVGVGADTLVITLTAESWLSVQDAMRSLVSELHPAGQTLTIKGQAPFQVNIGNAPAVSMTINGKPVDLRPHTKGAVATLTVRP